MKSACCIIGAGYSFVGGLPLTKDLLDSRVVVVSKQTEQRFQKVWQDYEGWQTENFSRGPEEYLADLHKNRPRSGCLFPPDPLFSLAVELLAVALATPRGYDKRPINPRYGIRVTHPSHCNEHRAFWKCITDIFQDIVVVTTNYDLLIERSLRHRPMKRGFGPGFYYGGMKRPQVLKGTALPFSMMNQQRFVMLEGSIPIYKLHGSLNWALDTNELEVYQDMRPAFRYGGDTAIVPPVPAEKVPSWLRTIWEEAEYKLSQMDCWIVCGYSLPHYDIAIREMFRRASSTKPKKIFILDPNSRNLHNTYNRLALGVEIHCLAGLPEGIQQLRDLATE